MIRDNKKVYSSGNSSNLGRGSRPITVNGEPLTDIEGAGFTWGFDGRRDRNLAHSIMADYFEDENVPRALWIVFYDEVIANLDSKVDWDITGQMISEWIYKNFESGEEPEVTETSEPVTTERRKEKPEPVGSSRPLYNEESYTPIVKKEEPEEYFDDFDDDEEELEDEDEDTEDVLENGKEI